VSRFTRIWIVLLLVPSLLVIGFMLGTMIGAKCCVPQGSGLAGPAIVLGYGVLGAGLALLTGILLAIKLPTAWLLGITLPAGIIGAVLAGILIKVVLDSNAKREEHLKDGYMRMSKFAVTIEPTAVATSRSFEQISFDWGSRSFSVMGNGQKCSEDLSGRQAVRMLGALRGAEGVLLKDPFPCAGTLGDVEQRLSWVIPESLPPDNIGELAITAACLRAYPELGKPLKVAEQIFRDSKEMESCR